MPEKQLTIAGYAAGASLAAITLVYVFAPTFFIDGDANGNVSGKKRGAIGLVNVANDCFINSVLQALAGLGDLRLYLIRETHRRALDGDIVYGHPVEDPARKGVPLWKIDGLQKGIVTHGLKDVLDALNERPLYKKTISANDFVKCLETAFRQRISRQQQDAQEFLQVVAERLCDEYHAGRRARRHAGQAVPTKVASVPGEPLDKGKLERTLSQLANSPTPESGNSTPGIEPQDSTDAVPEVSGASQSVSKAAKSAESQEQATEEDEEGFPFEGKSESQIECLTCGFKPKASESTFCSLTLNVPQVTSTSLNSCFDGMFKTEYIEDFKCEKCRLVHALETLRVESSRSNSDEFKTKAEKDIAALMHAIETDPEKPLEGVTLPDSKFAPKRKIARHQRITGFPKVMAIHLSRSIFDVGRNSMKNSAKVQFPEKLPLGGLLHQKRYKLLGVVTHKGSHHSGHYESFRRQNIYAPFSTPNVFDKSGVYSKAGTPIISTISTPQISASANADSSAIPATPLSAASSQSADSLPIAGRSPSKPSHGPTSAHRDPDSVSIRSMTRSARNAISKVPSNISASMSRTSTTNSTPRSPNSHTTSAAGSPVPTTTTSTTKPMSVGDSRLSKVSLPKRKRKASDRWWRISDEKVKESKTSDVLGMQKEVYLLFYELEREVDGEE